VVDCVKNLLIKYRRKILALIIVVCVANICILFTKVQFNFVGDFEGVFIIAGENSYWWEITDDLFPEEADRFIWGMPLSGLKDVASVGACNAKNESCINFEWNNDTGRGFIKNIFPDGRKLLICLSRFEDTLGIPSKGLFVGGNLPMRDPDCQIFNKNETGMAYFDGKRYYHIWCNVNEAIVSAAHPEDILYPTKWEFLGSRIIENDKKSVTLTSRHLVKIDGVPFSVEKFLFYEAGDSYFHLITKVTNKGYRSAAFYYAYGDEPWLGDFGSSEGDVGWVKGRLVTTETLIDTKADHFAGMFDYGNSLAGEKHENYTGKANFIEWSHDSRPDVAYFSNKEGAAVIKPNSPLNSPDCRFIGLQWGPKRLNPGGTFSFSLAIGMAANDPATGFPQKPVTSLN
jgi:hypothetical protein